jgi:hypothetical protein
MTDPDLVLSLRRPLRRAFGLLCLAVLISCGGVVIAVARTPMADGEPKIVPTMQLFTYPRPSLAKPMIVTCWVRNADPQETVTLRFHYSLTLTDGETPTKVIGKVDDHGRATVTWRLQASRTGAFKLTAVTLGAAPASTVISPGKVVCVFDG